MVSCTTFFHPALLGKQLALDPGQNHPDVGRLGPGTVRVFDPTLSYDASGTVLDNPTGFILDTRLFSNMRSTSRHRLVTEKASLEILATVTPW